MISRRGWALAGSAIGLFVSGRILGLVQLCVLAVAAVLVLAAAVAWVRANQPRLDARRELRERLQVGVQGRVDVVVQATRATPTLAVNDAFDGGRRAARLLLAPLRSGEEARAAYRFPTDRRGRFEVGPLRATVSDPFGLATVSRRVLASEDVIVYPHVHDVPAPPEVAGLDLDRDHPAVRARVEPTGDFMTLRDYAPGDDLRHVHWRSTARRGHLMMRQNETGPRAPVLVVLDVRPGAHERASFERAVEACASIATALARAGRPFEVVWSTGVVVGAPGRRHLATVMDELAVVQPHGPDKIVLATTRRRSSAVVAVMGRDLPHDAAALGVLVRDGGLLLRVATNSTPAGFAPARTRRFRVVAIPAYDRPFPTAWNEAMLQWQRSGNRPTSPSHAPG